MSERLNGVNFGGWLVLERWITPGLFAGTDAKDEYTFMQTLDAARKIDEHRKTWITEPDFEWLADHGINAVRIPVGYWLIKPEPPFAGGIEYLDWAFEMAEKYGLKILLDFHGLPGFQNGHDHSGREGRPMWQKDPEYRRRSLTVLKAYAERFATRPALWGIEIINEPDAGAFQLPLRRYYRDAYRLLDRILPPRAKVVYSDAWSPRIFAFALLGKRRAVMDVHQYHMATLGSDTHSLEWYYRKLRRRISLLRALTRLHPIIIGEWSGILRNETVGDLPREEIDVLEQSHLVLQRELYERFAGTFYWTYKLEDRGLNYWDFRSLY